MAESHCCSPETITTLLMGYTQQNKKVKKKKKELTWNLLLGNLEYLHVRGL